MQNDFDAASGADEEERERRDQSPPEKHYAHYLTPTQWFNLDHACALINKAFGYGPTGGFGCYLVGSALKRRDFRDVDVRYIMSDEGFDALFLSSDGWNDRLWSLMCLTTSAWLSERAGVPVDFQIQRQTQANESHGRARGCERNALGHASEYPGELPTQIMPAPPTPTQSPEPEGETR